MFDIGWTELLLIGIVALIVVGPKDLPGLFRNLGRFMGKARSMAREFQRAMEQAADDSGVKDMAREFKDAASGKDFGAEDLKGFAKGPKAWAREAARKSVVRKDDVIDPPDGGKSDTGIAKTPETGPAAAPDATATAEQSRPAQRPRGPATQALAAARSREAEARRAEAARRIHPPAEPAVPSVAAEGDGATRTPGATAERDQTPPDRTSGRAEQE